jgi:pantetheine-phosphate adenylyltransferase
VSASDPVVAICPGTYDPVTNGHLDIIRRAAAIFDRVVVAVVREPPHKTPLFSIEERVEFIRDALPEAANVDVAEFSELVVDFARRFGARTMVKGLRAISDFEWEFQMHHLNRTLAPEIETTYLIADSQFSFVSSSSVKEIASFGGNVDSLVPEAVARRFRELFPQPKPGAPVSPQE